MQNRKQMIIAIDFDGTIVRSDYPNIIGPQPYAADVINALHENGNYIIIWTCRTGEILLEAINWLLEHDIRFNRINDHNPENLSLYGDGGKKIYADVYIDDKNLGGFPGWKEVEKMLLSENKEVAEDDIGLLDIIYP